MNYSVTGVVYRVLDGEDWFEYQVRLFDGDDEIVDEWDSLFECYSVQNGGLSHGEAVAAVQEITADVHAGNASDWFDL